MRKKPALCRFGMGYAGITWACARLVQTIAHDGGVYVQEEICSDNKIQ